ncbi:MAG: hypothetical protein OXF25_06050 [Cyanobacteria bacterium MAG CAR3_bin_5]|nr:hypothetical protein [Cyanobacteria bacterium MAG CAR3_bin_5]
MTVTSVVDSRSNNRRATTINHTATSADANYNNINIADVGMRGHGLAVDFYR